MTPSKLHQLWLLLNSNFINLPLALEDSQLVDWLAREFQEKHYLHPRDEQTVKNYLNSRMLLIRELAELENIRRLND